MNIYQQNNTFARHTSIQIVNVIFNQIIIDSNINNLLTNLKVSFSEFERLVRMNMPAVDIRRKAIEINSTFEVLMGSTNEVKYDHKYEFSKKIIESCVAVIEKYKQAEEDVNFGFEFKDELKSSCINFFKIELGNYLDEYFWFELKYYEWLDKEGFLYENHSRFVERSNRYHSDDCLEDFFKENRGVIIRKMLNESRDYNNRLTVRSPLSDKTKNTIFNAYKILPSMP